MLDLLAVSGLLLVVVIVAAIYRVKRIRLKRDKLLKESNERVTSNAALPENSNIELKGGHVSVANAANAETRV